ncbi:hypothetical protein B0H34DRAFT_676902 [Crassisporium funariophilum]|nr:hypothetical protein B0H34DRAFT_676902 [Crassisporium funariophilum]
MARNRMSNCSTDLKKEIVDAAANPHIFKKTAPKRHYSKVLRIIDMLPLHSPLFSGSLGRVHVDTRQLEIVKTAVHCCLTMCGLARLPTTSTTMTMVAATTKNSQDRSLEGYNSDDSVKTAVRVSTAGLWPGLELNEDIALANKVRFYLGTCWPPQQEIIKATLLPIYGHSYDEEALVAAHDGSKWKQAPLPTNLFNCYNFNSSSVGLRSKKNLISWLPKVSLACHRQIPKEIGRRTKLKPRGGPREEPAGWELGTGRGPNEDEMRAAPLQKLWPEYKELLRLRKVRQDLRSDMNGSQERAFLDIQKRAAPGDLILASAGCDCKAR